MSEEMWRDLEVITANCDVRMRDNELTMCECDFDAECRYAIVNRMIREWSRQSVE